MYLAQIEKHKFGGGKICLLSQKHSTKLWIPVAATNDRLLPIPHQYHTIAEGVLVLVELGPKREVIKLIPALPELLKLQQDWSMRVLNHNAEQTKIDEWKDSLSLQTFELRKLKENLELQKNMFAIEKTRLKEAVSSMRDRITALEAENEALKEGLGVRN